MAKKLKLSDWVVNSIFESGSNSNGNYIKFADGTMICSKKVEINTKIASAWGSLYESDKVSLGDFAKSFIDTPIINATQFQREVIISQVREFTTTSFGKIILLKPVADTSVNDYHIFLTAIGKWK